MVRRAARFVRRFILHRLFRFKRGQTRPDKVARGFVTNGIQSAKNTSLTLRRRITAVLSAAIARATEVSQELSRQPLSRRVARFTKRYSAQLSFALLVTIFLMVTVGEGQAYDVQSPSLALQLEDSGDGFIGKPQIFGGQTVLTGEVQQSVAIVYRVEPGDSMSSIAKRYSLSVGSILDANNMKATEIEKGLRPGVELLIPTEDTNTSLAWLDAINKAKAEERARAEAERQKQLALQQRATQTRNARTNVSYSSGDYTVIGRMWGQYNGGYPGHCTWYVNSVRSDLPNGMGNGGQYLANARARGMATGSTARVGAIIVTSESGYGHVGIVTAVGNGTVTVREMNYVGLGIVSQRTISANFYAIKGYVY